MPLSPGTKLGPYEILTPLGAGGMGEVYRAKDTRLDRTVAVKILPSSISADPVAKQRFEREAKTISSLNHPNICTLYDVGSQDGVDYIVMECVEGEPLAKRLEKGPLPLEQVLRFGEQIAHALSKAHRNGVVHRDLKPGNIMLTKTGAKLLDFGLAKESSPLAAGTLTADVPAQAPVTQEGTIVGTFHYMSPEQVEGKEVDGRSDIFSLGAVLYETVMGQRAFRGKSQLSVASAILEKEPEPLSLVKPTPPAALDHVIRRCLAKEPDNRWQSAADLAGELRWIAESGSQAEIVATDLHATEGRGWLAWTIAGVSALAALAFGLRLMRPTPQANEVIRYSIAPPAGGTFLFGGFREGAALSPDGRKIAYLVRSAGVTKLWLRPLDSLEGHPLPGTENAQGAFWSPDSENVAFVADGKLKRVSPAGGPALTICEADGSIRGGTWNRAGDILFGTSPGPIYRVSASGGVPQALTILDAKRSDLLHRWPYFLPDGNHFLYLAGRTVTAHESNAVMIGSLDEKESKLLFRASSPVAYANGYLVYVSDQKLVVRSFDSSKLELTGEPVSLADGVLFDPFFVEAGFSVSSNRVLLYQQGKPFSGYSLALLNREGKDLGGLKEPGMYFFPRFSPDGKRVAYHSPDLQSGKSNIWVWDIASGNRTRLTFAPTYNRVPMWSPDGARVAYIATDPGRNTVFLKPADGIRAEEKLAELSAGLPVLTQWTPDGKFLLFEDIPVDTKRSRIGLLPTTGNAQATTLLENSDGSMAGGVVSADGSWLAYRSTETGRSEIYITSFPKPGGKLQVSSAGGGSPRWRGDGKELFYVAPDCNVMAAELRISGGSLEIVSVHALFKTGPILSSKTAHFDVTADGTKFAQLWVSGEETSASLNIVVNWDAELKK